MVHSDRPRHNTVGEDGMSSDAGNKNMELLSRFGPSVLLAVLLLAFVLGNTEPAEVSFLFFSATLPLVVVLLATALVGSLITLLMQHRGRKARRRG